MHGNIRLDSHTPTQNIHKKLKNPKIQQKPQNLGLMREMHEREREKGFEVQTTRLKLDQDKILKGVEIRVRGECLGLERSGSIEKE